MDDFINSLIDTEACQQCKGYMTIKRCHVCREPVCHYCSETAGYIVFNPQCKSYYIIGISHIDVDIFDYEIEPCEHVAFVCREECFDIYTALLDISVNDFDLV